MGSPFSPQAYKLQRAACSSVRHEVTFTSSQGQGGAGVKRQHHYGSLHQQHGWARERIDNVSRENLEARYRKGNGSGSQTHCRSLQHHRGHAQSFASTIRVDASSKTLRVPRQVVGSTQHRQVCVSEHGATRKVQQQILRPTDIGRRCPGPTGVGTREQLREPTVQVVDEDPRRNRTTKGICDSNCPTVARTALAHKTGGIECSSPAQTTQPSRSHAANGGPSRTFEKSSLENIRVEDIWREKLTNLGWCTRAREQFLMHWADTTMSTYNRQINRFRLFCVQQGHVFPCNEESVVAAFLSMVAEGSQRPRSVLGTCVAALVCLFDAFGIANVAQLRNITRLVDGLVKSGTSKPLTKTKVMPIAPFIRLFESWENDDQLSIKHLRMKTVCLLALAFMLRPSDVAPRGRHLDPETLLVEQFVFSEEQVTFHEDDTFTITFHGIKNDYSRDGFGVTLPPASMGKVDPAKCLLVYMDRTADARRVAAGSPVLLSLNRPFRAICAKTISAILNEAINQAGLGDRGYTAKCFRPTSATRAIDSGIKPDIARHIGRWKNIEVFKKHYVNSTVPSGYTDDALDI